ncbi:4079_t:CDS:1 [Funneliformis geosporum]|uniref:16146_t:CDS:1 n=1 Tax=Funneliformis geosporum TaxID=1117311 RepID=A0A9W4X0T3_9GLOM|nr:4079_t:CDS:1 [Funneliformis geosporum]CAI2178020.1 16146_t:CDS:1 [Funneliformis geosporum]
MNISKLRMKIISQNSIKRLPVSPIQTLNKRSYAATKSIAFVRPELFTQQIVLTNGATYTLRTTSPKPQIKLIRDTRNHPLWNPSKYSQELDDESGQLSKFIKRFGEEEYDLEFMESNEQLPELTSKDLKMLGKGKGKKK